MGYHVYLMCSCTYRSLLGLGAWQVGQDPGVLWSPFALVAFRFLLHFCKSFVLHYLFMYFTCNYNTHHESFVSSLYV